MIDMCITDFIPSESDIAEAEHNNEQYDRFCRERLCEAQTFEQWRSGFPPLLFKYRSLKTAKDLARVIDILSVMKLIMLFSITLRK